MDKSEEKVNNQIKELRTDILTNFGCTAYYRKYNTSHLNKPLKECYLKVYRIMDRNESLMLINEKLGYLEDLKQLKDELIMAFDVKPDETC